MKLVMIMRRVKRRKKVKKVKLLQMKKMKLEKMLALSPVLDYLMLKTLMMRGKNLNKRRK